MVEENKVKACKQEQCPVRESGKCLEGLDPDACSHFYWETIDIDNEITEKAIVKSSEPSLIRLFDGNELTIDTIGMVTNKYDTCLIIIIGESNSGKTTILTSLYDMFQTGEFREHYFAGSLTQIGFETRCHLSRSCSKSNIPETLKTPNKDFSFLHISYKKSDNLDAEATHILLSDISGERFALANASSSIMTEMDLMKNADHLVYLLDVEKLSNKFEKRAVLTKAAQFVTRAIDNKIFTQETDLHVVFSKGDILQSLDNPIVEEVINEFQSRFNQRLKNIKFSIVASRPKPPTDKFPFGYGLEDLLELWKVKYNRQVHLNFKEHFPKRYFDKYI